MRVRAKILRYSLLVVLNSVWCFPSIGNILTGEPYQINSSIYIMSSNSSEERLVRPDSGHSFYITGEMEASGRYRNMYPIQMRDAQGNIVGNFYTSASNAANHFVLPDVVGNLMAEGFGSVEDLNECLHCEAQAQGLPATRPQPRPENLVPDFNGEVCQHYQRFLNAGVPSTPLKQALLFFQENKDKFSNQRYISIADYSQHSNNERFFILDMQTGEVRSEKVSHGSGNRGGVNRGDARDDGMIERCHHGNNINDRENMTRAGFFATANFYQSGGHTDYDSRCGRQREWPYLDSNGNNGLRMEGLSPGANDEAMGSGVVMHGAWYNTDGCRSDSIGMGRSWGCPAFDPDVAGEVLNTIRGGTMYYSYTPICTELHAIVERQVNGWQGMCE